MNKGVAKDRFAGIIGLQRASYFAHDLISTVPDIAGGDNATHRSDFLSSCETHLSFAVLSISVILTATGESAYSDFSTPARNRREK